jgi:hypothetical protein
MRSYEAQDYTQLISRAAANIHDLLMMPLALGKTAREANYGLDFEKFHVTHSWLQPIYDELNRERERGERRSDYQKRKRRAVVVNELLYVLDHIDSSYPSVKWDPDQRLEWVAQELEEDEKCEAYSLPISSEHYLWVIRLAARDNDPTGMASAVALEKWEELKEQFGFAELFTEYATKKRNRRKTPLSSQAKELDEYVRYIWHRNKKRFGDSCTKEVRITILGELYGAFVKAVYECPEESKIVPFKYLIRTMNRVPRDLLRGFRPRKISEKRYTTNVCDVYLTGSDQETALVDKEDIGIIKRRLSDCINATEYQERKKRNMCITAEIMIDLAMKGEKVSGDKIRKDPRAKHIGLGTIGDYLSKIRKMVRPIFEDVFGIDDSPSFWQLYNLMIHRPPKLIAEKPDSEGPDLEKH